MIDIFIVALNERFESKSYQLYAQLEEFLLLAANENKTCAQGLHLLKEKYSDDIDVDNLVIELPLFHNMCADLHIVSFDDILDALASNNMEKLDIIPNIARIVMLIQINPATSATPERSFSLARRLKTWKRSTMLAKRFNALAILNCHKERTDNIDMTKVANEFVSLYPDRKMTFGKFVPEDFDG